MSYEAETITKHAKQIADDLEKRMEFWANVSHEDGRDGRELIVGPLFMLVRQCRAAGMTKAHIKAIIDNTDSFDAGGKFTREASLLVSPNGRPLHKVG